MIYDREVYHYLMLHFPIALFIVGYMFDLFSFYKNDLNMEKYGFLNLSLGILTGIITIITGFITDNALVGHMQNPFPIWSTHGTHMIVAIILFFSIFIIRYYFKYMIEKKYVLFLHGLVLIFFIHGTHIGAKLAARL